MNQPNPSSKNYEDLLAEIRTGRIKIPQFQRNFVWERDRSARLLDSILKGYPIGTFILWKTRERLRAVKNIGGIDLPDPPAGDYTQQVLDGQQRLTSLFAALEGAKLHRDTSEESATKDSKVDDFGLITVDLSVDPNSDEPIVYSSPSEVPVGHEQVAFKDLRTAEAYELASRFNQDLLKKFAALKQRLTTYRFSTIEIADVSLDVATEVFTRLNVGGKPLTVFEIMVAKTWDEKADFDLAKKAEDLNSALRKGHFGELDPTVLMHAVSAVAIQSIKKVDILAMSRGDFIAAWSKAEVALRSAVDFCRTDLAIPVRGLLPYERSLIPLAYFFSRHPYNPSGEAKARLIDLFFRIGLGERYSGPVETNLAQDLKVVDDIIAGRPSTFDWGVGTSAEFILKNGAFRAGKAYIKTLLCVLASAGPKSFRTGGKISLGNTMLKHRNGKNYHHFFPVAFVQKHLPSVAYPVNHVGNITLVDGDLNRRAISARRPSEYLAAFKLENPEFDASLASHLIDPVEMGVWDDAYDTFLLKRCEAISRELRKFIISQPVDSNEAVELIDSTPDDTEESDDA